VRKQCRLASPDIASHRNYVISVPENMDKPATAPLLCAGITCYSPFVDNGVKAGQTMGVVGLGGLGHMVSSIFFNLMLPNLGVQDREGNGMQGDRFHAVAVQGGGRQAPRRRRRRPLHG
jgi:D-arabinose 1-dehydrogenase-like Zn-dependent alcohol dehydrogenase